MSRPVKLISFAMGLVVSAQASAANWQIQAVEGSNGVVLTYGAGDPVSYRFECTASSVLITETGVTELMNLQNGSKIGDGADAVMPPGAAVMALFTGKGDPQFLPAQATKNPAGGWNLTIQLSKDDKQLKAIGKSELLSLFTTGYTMAVGMEGDGSAKWSDFMKRCKAVG